MRNRFAENCARNTGDSVSRVRAHGGNAYHLDGLRVDGLGDDAVLVAQVLDQLVQSCPLHLLPLEVAQWLREVEQHAALAQFLDEQLLTLGGSCI